MAPPDYERSLGSGHLSGFILKDEAKGNTRQFSLWEIEQGLNGLKTAAILKEIDWSPTIFVKIRQNGLTIILKEDPNFRSEALKSQVGKFALPLPATFHWSEKRKANETELTWQVFPEEVESEPASLDTCGVHKQTLTTYLCSLFTRHWRRF